jgi:hypothetical protein
MRQHDVNVSNKSWVDRFWKRLAHSIAAITLIAGTALSSLHSFAADIPGELLLFTDVTGFERSHQAGANGLRDHDLVLAIDFFYALDRDRFRFLGEYLADTNDHALERFQLGVRAGEATVWLGRFHNPIGYWNTQYHHGAYLQTTASRPGILEFEGGDGPLPMHLTGILVEGIRDSGTAGIHYTFGAGLGPVLTDALAPFDILHPESSHRFGATLRLSYQPVSYGLDEAGFSLSYTNIPASTPEVELARQSVATLFGNWHFGPVRALGELFIVQNRLDQPNGDQITKRFSNAYVQLEYPWSEKLTIFTRFEKTLARSEDQYLDFFGKVVRDRALLGGRYNFYRNMALKLEVSKDKLEQDRFNQIMLQWSAVFP